MKIHNIVSLLMMLLEAVLLIATFFIPFPFTAYIAVILFAFFAWSFHWLAHFSGNMSHNNRIIGFFITLFFFVFFVLSLIIVNYP